MERKKEYGKKEIEGCVVGEGEEGEKGYCGDDGRSENEGECGGVEL